MSNLAIVIINYRTGGMTVDCLASLEAEQQRVQFQVVVVDNASADESPDYIEQTIVDREWGRWVQLLRSEVNAGFSAGNNLGIASIHANAYLLLNSDTIVNPNAIYNLLGGMYRHPEAGLFGPRLIGSDSDAQTSCFRFPSFFSEVIRGACTGPVTRLLQRWNVSLPVMNQPMETPWISFAAVLIRREVLEKVGLMDDGYFMYFEDMDYCRRAQNAGWKIQFCPDSEIVHLQGQSSRLQELNASRQRRPTYYYAARSRYYRKWSGRLGLIVANLGWCVGRIVGGMRDLLGRNRTSCEREWRDNWLGWNRRMEVGQPKRLKTVDSITQKIENSVNHA